MNNQLSPIPWQTLLKKSVIWGLWLFFLALLQTSFFSFFDPFGAVPDLVLPAVIAIAVFDKERMGTIAGIVGGFIIDALGGVGLSLSPLVYMICGVAAALLVHSIFRRDFLSWLILTALGLVISGASSVICGYASVSFANVTAAHIFSRLLIPAFLSSIIIAIPFYFLTKLIWSRLFDNREMEG